MKLEKSGVSHFHLGGFLDDDCFHLIPYFAASRHEMLQSIFALEIRMTAKNSDGDLLRIGRWMSDDKIFTTGFTNNLRVGAIAPTMLLPMVFKNIWNVVVEPVKWSPARCSFAMTMSPTSAPSPNKVDDTWWETSLFQEMAFLPMPRAIGSWMVSKC